MRQRGAVRRHATHALTALVRPFLTNVPDERQETVTMRDVLLFVDVTVDGFMAGPNNDLSVMVEDADLYRTMTTELMARADTIIVGGKVFHDMAAYWTTAPDLVAPWVNAAPKVVLSNP